MLLDIQDKARAGLISVKSENIDVNALLYPFISSQKDILGLVRMVNLERAKMDALPMADVVLERVGSPSGGTERSSPAADTVRVIAKSEPASKGFCDYSDSEDEDLVAPKNQASVGSTLAKAVRSMAAEIASGPTVVQRTDALLANERWSGEAEARRA